MPLSLINFDKKGPENQVINFVWPKVLIFLFIKATFGHMTVYILSLF